MNPEICDELLEDDGADEDKALEAGTLGYLDGFWNQGAQSGARSERSLSTAVYFAQVILNFSVIQERAAAPEFHDYPRSA